MVVNHTRDYFFLGWWPLLFSLEWWGHFLVRGVWFPSSLPLEGSDRIQNFHAFHAQAMRMALGRPGGSDPQSLTTHPTRLCLATTVRMSTLQVESPKCGVCLLISTVGRYL
jgi:hypothetical protein